jgi:hypothetical protein
MCSVKPGRSGRGGQEPIASQAMSFGLSKECVYEYSIIFVYMYCTDYKHVHIARLKTVSYS